MKHILAALAIIQILAIPLAASDDIKSLENAYWLAGATRMPLDDGATNLNTTSFWVNGNTVTTNDYSVVMDESHQRTAMFLFPIEGGTLSYFDILLNETPIAWGTLFEGKSHRDAKNVILFQLINCNEPMELLANRYTWTNNVGDFCWWDDELRSAPWSTVIFARGTKAVHLNIHWTFDEIGENSINTAQLLDVLLKNCVPLNKKK